MTTAQRMADLFRLIPSETDNGSMWDQYREHFALANFVAQCYHTCAELAYPLGSTSEDPPTRFYFHDGSTLEVTNPLQVKFPARVESF